MDGRRARCVLGVARDAGPDEIRRAFRARAFLTHPDHGGSADAFAEVHDAFEALRNVAPRPLLLPVVTHIDVYDSPSRPAPRRDFADVLAACMRRAG